MARSYVLLYSARTFLEGRLLGRNSVGRGFPSLFQLGFYAYPGDFLKSLRICQMHVAYSTYTSGCPECTRRRFEAGKLFPFFPCLPRSLSRSFAPIFLGPPGGWGRGGREAGAGMKWVTVGEKEREGLSVSLQRARPKSLFVKSDPIILLQISREKSICIGHFNVSPRRNK